MGSPKAKNFWESLLMRNAHNSQLNIQGCLGGLIAGISISEGQTFLMPFSLALLWSVSRRPKSAFFWGFFALLVSHRWLLFLHPLDWIGIPSFLSLPLTVGIWICLGVLSGFLVSLWALIGIRISEKAPFSKSARFEFDLSYAVLLSSLWGLSEVVMAHSPLFWIGLGSSMLPGNMALAALARWVGAGGLAAIQLIIGYWIWQLSLSLKDWESFWKKALIGIFCLLSAHSSGWLLLLDKDAYSSLPVAIWQTNIPVREKFLENRGKTIPVLLQKALEEAKNLSASFLVVPEGTLKSNQKLLSPASVDLLSGGFRSIRAQQRSSILVFYEGEDRPSEAIDKHRLVPLGEWMPTLFGKSFPGLSAVGGLHSGAPSRLLMWDGPPVATAICYEIADGFALNQAVKDGAQWILSVANLDPYPQSLQREFLAIAQLRSLETARDLISSANTGPSGVVSAFGEKKKIFPAFESRVDLVDLQLHDEITFYTKYRELPLIICLIFASYSFFFRQKKNS